MSAANPASFELREGVVVSYFKLGSVYAAQGKRKEALAWYQKAEAELEALWQATRIPFLEG